MLTSAAEWLADAGVRRWAAGEAYPWINTLHLLGLVMLVGGIGVVDLRVAGAWRALPAAALSRALTPVAMVGLVISTVTGVLLFAADGAALAESETFRTKLLLIGLVLTNAIIFRTLWRDRIDRPPLPARLAAVASLLLWLGVATLGRLIAYS